MDPWITTLLGAVALSTVHTLIPSHWLIFVMAGRTQQWSLGKTLGVVALCGTGHVISTLALGVLAARLGKEVLGETYLDWIVSGLLIAIGCLYVVLYLVRREHREHRHAPPVVSDRTTVATLMVMLILSPCEGVISVFVAGAGITAVLNIVILGVTLLVTTVGAMILLVTVTYSGLARFQFHFLEHHEKAIIGLLLILLGAVTAVLK